MALVIILVYAVVAIYQVPKLIKKQQKKELVYFCVFLLIGFVLSILLNAGVKIPSTTSVFMDLFDMLNLHY